MNPERARFLSDADRRDALYGRHPGKYHFADEEPEPRGGHGGPTATRHEHDGYCGLCYGWMPKGSPCL